MKKKRTLFIILCVLLCLYLTTCSVLRQCSGPPRRAWNGPKSGLWYCEELKMQLYIKDLELEDVEKLENGSFDSHSYVLVNDELTMCNISKTHAIGENRIIVSRYEETFLDAESVSSDETTWIVRDVDGKTYTFCKIAHLPLHQFWNENKSVIDAYSGVTEVGEVHHIEIAKEKALSLWESELNLGGVWQQTDLTVSFNYENACWLIIGTQVDGKTPYALIQKSGKVDAVWIE